MNKYTATWVLLILAVAATCNGQGLTTTAKPTDWEEINFEFNSAVLTDGYPTLLRLAALLQQNPAFKVTVAGNCDFIGSDQVNNKLSLDRAQTVKAFLVKYGARPEQIEAVGFGKTKPEVSNASAPGRFMNRRVVLTLIDGKGNVISEGGIGQVVKTFEDCCQEVLKRLEKLDKLDEILALLKEIKAADLDNLRKEIADLRSAMPSKQEAPAPPSVGKPAQPAVAEIAGARQEPPKAPEAAVKAQAAAPQLKRFSLLGLNAGYDQFTANLTVAGRARFFQPFGSSFALQSQGEYIFFKHRQEAQFDFGLVDRLGHHAQLGLFSSFKRVQFTDLNAGATLGQASGTLDYIFSRGRAGIFGTKSFLDGAVISRQNISQNVVQESFLRVVDQLGASAQVGLWRNAYLEGNIGALFGQNSTTRPGGSLRFVQPLNSHWAFTAEGGFNETLVTKGDNGREFRRSEGISWLESGRAGRYPADKVRTAHPHSRYDGCAGPHPAVLCHADKHHGWRLLHIDLGSGKRDVGLDNRYWHGQYGRHQFCNSHPDDYIHIDGARPGRSGHCHRDRHGGPGSAATSPDPAFLRESYQY
jgi:hypothetical protein